MALCFSLAVVSSSAKGSDLFDTEPAALLRTDTFSAEINAGYLSGTAQEYVYDTSTKGNPKLSQLTWDLGNTFALGGRVAFRPLDWLTVRVRGWAAVTGNGGMQDYDWLYGYHGPNSYSHISSSPDTDVAKAWQGDVSLAAAYYRDEQLALTVIGGFRHFDVKWNAKGGSYNYYIGSPYQYSGVLPNQIGIAYEQWWDTPYLGLGAFYNEGDWTLSLEGIGSAFAMSRDQDYHALRTLLIKGNYDQTAFAGVTAGLEYKVSSLISLAGRVEYQKYFETKGEAKYLGGEAGGYAFYPKPGVGAEAETVLVSFGVKARI